MFQMNRRSFVKGAALAVSSFAVNGCVEDTYPSVSRSVAPKFRDAKEKIKIGVVGVGGKGWSDWTPMFDNGEDIVALCDVDRKPVERALKYISDRRGAEYAAKVKCYSDYRLMLDECGKICDAVTVSTPDHTHGPAAIRAMRQGCHVYVQKPLVRTIWEAHYFEKVAKECGVVTQMGNQGSANSGLRRNVEVLQAGVLGKMTEVHVWTNRPIWPQGILRPDGSDPIPENLDWNSWIGTAPMRPYKQGVYHTFKWRGFFDFGTGAFGDMACHTMNVPFRGLKLGAVESVECVKIEGNVVDGRVNDDTYPSKSIVKLHYAAREGMPPVTLFWYDGNLKPSADIMPAVINTLGSVPNTGCLIIGDKGMMVSTNDYGAEAYVALNGEAKMKSVAKHPACAEDVIKPFLPRAAKGHYLEFVNAVKGTDRCFSDIDVSIPMLEGMLVGCIGQCFPGEKLAWNSARQTFGNRKADALITPYIRKGWEY
ncbi:MAG: Gfo/Idh/MocA family oxidoreductase [Kiritimatiellae bacterium]|nr:Gfo/Idh/MocA family oxidoreductase [Kiritimatiellia bacterium]